MIQIAKVSVNEILELREQGYKYREIAEKLGTTDKYCKRLVYEASHPEIKQKNIKAKKRKYNQKEEGIEIPGTDMVISKNKDVIEYAVGQVGNEKVSTFVNYHLDMMRMRQGVDKSNPYDLYNRLKIYLEYCSEHQIIPNNMNAYFAIGIDKNDVSHWYTGKRGTPEHRKFAEDIKALFSSIHEQGAANGLINPILTIFWQKCYDGFIEASKVEQTEESPLGDRQTAEQIADKWSTVELPD